MAVSRLDPGTAMMLLRLIASDVELVVLRLADAVAALERGAARLRTRALSVLIHGPLRAIRGIAADPGGELRQVEELVRLSAQLVGHHWRLRGDRGHHRDPD